MSGEDAVYDFLTKDLERFRERGEVFVTDRLRRKQLQPTRASVGVSVSDGMLTLDLDTGEFPAGELEGLYQSLLKKKKYHRLPDGRFLTLDGGSYEKLAEMAHMLQLSPKELAKGELKVPAFRALYLDSILSGGEELDVTRDRQFRSLIRNFKSIDESDYTVPVHLQKVLRPYQQTGFRWLKTLESCGFGGILADEMGLGKTVQVIDFLASQEGRKHPNLVVCPASLILNWGEEFEKFAPELKVSLIYGTAPERKKRIGESSGMAANGHQILLFSQFTSMLDILRERLEELGLTTYTIQGSTPKEQRVRLVKDFNAGGAQVFFDLPEGRRHGSESDGGGCGHPL